MLDRIRDGRTDLIFDYVAAGHPPTSTDTDGVSLLRWCAYYGDVSAIRFLLAGGESLESLGDDRGLNGAAFHGHWRLCEFLLEKGADVNRPLPETGETPLHAALCRADGAGQEHVVRILLARGADPSRVTAAGAETGCFMRDCRTKAETALHRAAAFASEETVQRLLDAGAAIDAKDMNGDSPLTWASWHLRPDSILTKLCYGNYSIRADRRSMESNLLGTPHLEDTGEEARRP